MGFIQPVVSQGLIHNGFLECCVEKDFMMDPYYWKIDVIYYEDVP